MTLARRLGKLEVLVQAKAEDAAPRATYWTPARIEQWREWAQRILQTMPYERARRAFDELEQVPAEQWGPTTRRVAHLAYMGAGGHYDGSGWPHYDERVIALPEGVCEILERYPDALWTSDFSCEDCGLETPHRSWEDWNRYRVQVKAAGGVVDPADRALMTACPLCGGRVRWCGWLGKRQHELWLQQKAEDASRQS